MKAIMPVLDDSRKKPYYLQLYDYIKEAILKGEIRENEKLPSLRCLSRSTGLSVTTVEQSYNQLLVEGYVYSKAQSGYYVRDVFSHLSHTQTPSASELLAPQGTAENTSGPGEGTPVFHCDPDCFDFNKWKKCMNKILTEFSTSLFFESDPQGEPELRAEISRYLYMSRGVSCDPEQIIIGAGTQQITNHVADDGLIIEKLPTNIRTAVYVSPSNHVPTGAVMPIGRRYELMGWAASNDSYIIEDDYDSELRYFSKPIPALKSLENSSRVIYLGSFSSTLFAAVKISYMVLPENMARLFSSMAQDYSQTCSKLEQLTLAMFMESGHYQTHIKKLRKLYSQKLSAVTDTFAEEASDFVTVKNTSSGISVILNVKSRKTTEELKKDAEQLGIPAVPHPKEGLLALYYNQIPLVEIPHLFRTLIEKWRS